MANGDFIDLLRRTASDKVFQVIRTFEVIGTQPRQTSLRRLQDVLKRFRHLATKQDVVTTSAKRCWIYDVLKTSDLHRLEDVQFMRS